MHTDETAHKRAVGLRVIVRETVDVQRLVFFRRRELIGGAVIIDKKRLVAAHTVVRAETAKVGELPVRRVTHATPAAAMP